MSASRGRPLFDLATVDDDRLSELPVELARSHVLGASTCADAARFAATNKRNRAAAAPDLLVCRAVATLEARARRDVVEYVDLLFAAVARMIPDALLQSNDVLVTTRHRGRWLAAAWFLQAINAPELYVNSNVGQESEARVNAATVPEVRDQLNVLVSRVRRTTTYGGVRLPYRMATVVLAMGATKRQLLPLRRMLDVANSDVGDAGQAIADALRLGQLPPTYPTLAIAQALQLASMMSQYATTGIESETAPVLDPDAIDVDRVFRLCGIDPQRMRWIDTMARVLAALPDAARNEMALDEARAALTSLGVDWRASLPARRSPLGWLNE